MKFGEQYKYYKIPEYNDNYLDYDLLKRILKEILIEHITTTAANNGQTKTSLIDPFIRRNSDYIKKKKVNGLDLSEKLLKFAPGSPVEASKKKKKIEEIKSENVNVINDNADKSEKSVNNYFYKENLLNSDNLFEFGSQIKDDEEIYNLSNFMREYRKQTKNVDNFYRNQLKLNEAKLEKILNDIHLKNKSSVLESKNRYMNSNVSVYKMDYDKKKENSENDEMSYAASYKRVISDLYNSTAWLHSYCVINRIATQKIGKKAQNVCEQMKSMEIILQMENNNQGLDYFGELKEISILRKKIVEFYAREFTKGNESQAKTALESRMRGNKTNESFCLGVYLGIIGCLIFALLVLTFLINPKEFIDKTSDLMAFFPGFNFTLCINLLFIGLAFNIWVFKTYKINYLYIFEIDLKLRLGVNQIMKISLFLFCAWLIALYLTKISLGFDFLHRYFFIFGLILQIFFIVFLIFPFHCFYLQFRKGIWITFIRNFIPFGKSGVRFRDFMFGDILTSLTKPFASLVMSFCLITCRECREENITNNCNRKTMTCLVVMLTPFVIRFFQCLNRLYYTRMLWPHLANAIKYCFGFTNIFFSWLCDVDKETYLIPYLCIASLASTYMVFWDIYMDWGLARKNSKNLFLRNNILYPPKYYYFAIVVNICLRLTWLSILIDIKNAEMKALVMSILEVYRRSQWSLFRVENENANNPEQYRAVLEIPDYIYK